MPSPRNDKNVALHTIAQIKFIEKIMDLNKSRPLTQFLGMFKFNVQNTSKSRQTEAQKWSCKHWKKKLWMDGKLFNPCTYKIKVTDAVTAMTAACQQKGKIKQWNALYSAKDHELTFLATENLSLVKGQEINKIFGNLVKPKTTHHL